MIFLILFVQAVFILNDKENTTDYTTPTQHQMTKSTFYRVPNTKWQRTHITDLEYPKPNDKEHALQNTQHQMTKSHITEYPTSNDKEHTLHYHCNF